MRAALTQASDDAQRAIEGTLTEAEKRSRMLAERMRGGIAGSLSDVERLMTEAAGKSDVAAEHLRKDEPHNEFMRLAEARFRTRETHALDAAKFVGGAD